MNNYATAIDIVRRSSHDPLGQLDLLLEVAHKNPKAIINAHARINHPSSRQAAAVEPTGKVMVRVAPSFGEKWETKIDKGLMESVLVYIQNNQLIGAIKLVRAKTGLGLKDAKDLVETIRDHKPGDPSIQLLV